MEFLEGEFFHITIGKKMSFRNIHVHIKEIRNFSVLGTKHYYAKLIELNSYHTNEIRISRHQNNDLTVSAPNGTCNAAVITIRYKHDVRKAILGEILLPFSLIPFRKTIKIEHTFNIIDSPQFADVKKNPSIAVFVESQQAGCRDRPFQNIPVCIDPQMKKNREVIENFNNLVTFYVENREKINHQKMRITANEIPRPTAGFIPSHGGHRKLLNATTKLPQNTNICPFNDLFMAETDDGFLVPPNAIVFVGLKDAVMFEPPVPRDEGRKIDYFFEFDL
ncbi:hypothetical protein TRFO_21414 [Tritrichomonas foetus]|uniref:Uncharacterized protein n=1 Tax=Tritrichomonas foetus TaxID=1144522 RepID=A0A1J4KDV4_9EUKA|nr:hypothetical protein TRFO_21414 [Tritrichomonas foetus]|eukprot:OHT09615.1 hypothetical protein TRFO_21414 [Tritrichomonas foetus]